MRQWLRTSLLLACCAGASWVDASADQSPTTGPVTTVPTQGDDAAVLRVVFDDMLRADNGRAPREWTRDLSKPVYVSREAERRRLSVNDVLSRHDTRKWDALSDTERAAASEAADDVIARLERADRLPAFRSTSGRIKVYEEAGAATQPTATQPFAERGSSVAPPGYSKDRRYAVVHLAFPWSMHSGEVTYILERKDDGWVVVLSDFIYYV
ncbi:MAG: hypothetical protein QM770_24110 [Tepidisphaeraceae bacterium]